MPQASEELRDLMEDWFDDPVDLGGPIAMLQRRGWTLTQSYEWRPAVPSQTVHEIDFLLMKFLCDEWDFGGPILDRKEY